MRHAAFRDVAHGFGKAPLCHQRAPVGGQAAGTLDEAAVELVHRLDEIGGDEAHAAQVDLRRSEVRRIAEAGELRHPFVPQYRPRRIGQPHRLALSRREQDSAHMTLAARLAQRRAVRSGARQPGYALSLVRACRAQRQVAAGLAEPVHQAENLGPAGDDDIALAPLDPVAESAVRNWPDAVILVGFDVTGEAVEDLALRPAGAGHAQFAVTLRLVGDKVAHHRAPLAQGVDQFLLAVLVDLDGAAHESGDRAVLVQPRSAALAFDAHRLPPPDVGPLQ